VPVASREFASRAVTVLWRALVARGAAAFFVMTAYQLPLNAAELHVPKGKASIVVAAAPLVSVAIATLFLGERLTVTKVAAWLDA
jgi:drug/metabolite transporter (DMT)-like permease